MGAIGSLHKSFCQANHLILSPQIKPGRNHLTLRTNVKPLFDRSFSTFLPRHPLCIRTLWCLLCSLNSIAWVIYSADNKDLHWYQVDALERSKTLFALGRNGRIRGHRRVHVHPVCWWQKRFSHGTQSQGMKTLLIWARLCPSFPSVIWVASNSPNLSLQGTS